MKLKTFEELGIEETLAYKLDLELYLPIKEELAGKGITHSLGMRKERFKGTVAEELAKIKQEAIKWVKFYREQEMHWTDGDFMEFHNISEDELK